MDELCHGQYMVQCRQLDGQRQVEEGKREEKNAAVCKRRPREVERLYIILCTIVSMLLLYDIDNNPYIDGLDMLLNGELTILRSSWTLYTSSAPLTVSREVVR